MIHRLRSLMLVPALLFAGILAAAPTDSLDSATATHVTVAQEEIFNGMAAHLGHTRINKNDLTILNDDDAVIGLFDESSIRILAFP